MSAQNLQYFFLNYDYEKEPDIDNKANDIKVNNKGKVLIIDDDNNILNISSLMLEKMGFETFVVNNIDDAFEKYDYFLKKKIVIDFVIVDFNMNGNTGIDFIRRLREMDSNVVVVVATGCGDMTISEFKKYNVFDILKKPYSFEDLSLLVKKILNQEKHREF